MVPVDEPSLGGRAVRLRRWIGPSSEARRIGVAAFRGDAARLVRLPNARGHQRWRHARPIPYVDQLIPVYPIGESGARAIGVPTNSGLSRPQLAGRFHPAAVVP